MSNKKKKTKTGPERIENLTEKLNIINFKFAIDDLIKKHEIKHFLFQAETEEQRIGHSSKSPTAQLLGMIRIMEVDIVNDYCDQKRNKK